MTFFELEFSSDGLSQTRDVPMETRIAMVFAPGPYHEKQHSRT
jgi:hypothetical protein